MSILYVTERGAAIGRTSQRLVVRKAGHTLDEVLLADLEQVIVIGHVHLTSHALRGMLERGIDLALLTAGGAYLGRLSAGTSSNIELRRLQFQRLEDLDFVCDLARRYVLGKTRNMRTLLLRHQREQPSDQTSRALIGMRLVSERLQGETFRGEDGLDVIRGLEGQASALYFGAFGNLIRVPGIHFERRMRRPPPDPVNILLSFGYTLLTNLVHGYAEMAGLDPFFGALHRPLRGRPSLALDLIEEFRPVLVDTAVVRAINTRAIGPEDFVRIDEEEAPVEEAWEREEAESLGVAPARRTLLLTTAGVRKWISEFERRLAEQVIYPPTGTRLSYRQILREQVYQLVRHLKGEGDYQAFETRQ